MGNRLREAVIFVFLIFANTIGCNYAYFAVDQCPGIEVPDIRHQVELNEISFIFYYTQWSDESLLALQEYNDVAAYFGGKIYFAAINCWHLACNCSKALSTAAGSGSPHKWPTLMVHYGSIGQLKIQYTGLFTFRDMVHFIMNILYPLERIERIEDLDIMKTSTDGIVLGVFKNPNGFEYKNYLISALKWLEHDPLTTFRFTVQFASPKIFEAANVKEPNLLIFGQKARKVFSDSNNFKWNATNILRWLNSEFNAEYSRIHGYSTPITIAEEIKTHPVLAIFVNEPKNFFSYMEKFADNQKPFTKALLACDSTKNRKSVLICTSKFIRNFAILSGYSKCFHYNEILLKNLKFYYEIIEYFKVCQKDDYSAKSNLCGKDNYEVRDILSFYKSTICLLKKDLPSQISLHISIVKRLEDYLSNEQQSKSSNRSLSTFLLDTSRYKDFLENVNISPTYESMATVLIIDNEKENIYVMEEYFSMPNLMEFIKKFYSNSLNNYYKNKENNASSGNYHIVLKQLNRDVFLNYFQYSHNQTLVVLFYSTECALCGNIQQTFMQLSLLLRHAMNLKFIRINTMDNDLPWQFNMPFLPALLVFPENRFSESRIFPAHLKPDIRNMFGFILSQLPPRLQVKLVLILCQSGTLPKSHSQSCWQFAKTLLMQHIGKHLQYWQMFETERSLIFKRLSAFKEMSLDIQRNLRM